MEQRKEQEGVAERKPNVALRHVRRKLARLSQSQFAETLGVSAAYVQAIELGQRPATAEFAEKVRECFGIWPRSIVENWRVPVYIDGVQCAPVTPRPLPRTRTIRSVQSDLDKYLTTLSKILEGASDAGEGRLASSIVRDKLYEAAERIVSLDGVAAAINSKLASTMQHFSSEEQDRYLPGKRFRKANEAKFGVATAKLLDELIPNPNYEIQRKKTKPDGSRNKGVRKRGVGGRPSRAQSGVSNGTATKKRPSKQ